MTQLDPLLPEAEIDPDDRPAVDWPTDPWDEVDRTESVERLRRQTRPLKWIVYTSMVLTIVVILVAGAVGWWYLGKINPSAEVGEVQSFTIRRNDDLESLASRLEEQGLVSDADVFIWYAERDGDFDIAPGYYELRPNDHMGNVLSRLRTPPAQTFTKVTFPEGFTVEQIAARLDASVQRMSSRDFRRAARDPGIASAWRPEGITSLEGLLFPDTYDVSNAESEGQVIERMIGLMERVGRQEDIESRSTALGVTPYEALVIASLIEREAKVPEDRAKIARVIYNRLFFGQLLQIDASVYYGRDQAGIDADLPFSELRQIENPYNTYLNAGLPPTPIASPGRASIEAALNPAPNPPPGDPICRNLEKPSECFYLYYVLADEDGGHAFAATPEQHQANVDRAAALGLL